MVGLREKVKQHLMTPNQAVDWLKRRKPTNGRGRIMKWLEQRM